MKNCYVLLIVVGLFPYTYVMSAFYFLKTPSCDDYNRSYLSSFSTVLNNSKLNLDMDLIRPFLPGWFAHMDFFKRKMDIKQFESFYQRSLDMCGMLSLSKSNMFKKWFLAFFRYGNFVKHCPASANHYYLRDYQLSDLNVPAFLFNGIYRVKFNMTQSRGKTKDFVIRCVLDIEIK